VKLAAQKNSSIYDASINKRTRQQEALPKIVGFGLL